MAGARCLPLTAHSCPCLFPDPVLFLISWQLLGESAAVWWDLQATGLKKPSLTVFLSPCRDRQEEVAPPEHPSCPALEVRSLPVGVSPSLHSTHPPTQLLLFPPDSTNSSENMYTIMNPIGPGAGRANVSGGRCASPDGDLAGGGRPEPHAALCPQFPLGPSPEGPMASMSTMEPHHVNGSLGEWLGATYRFHRSVP